MGDHRLQDSSPDLAEALERAAEKYGARTMDVTRVKYTNCLCGLQVRCRLLPESLETQQARLTMYGAACPDCKRQVLINIAPPATAVQLAQPGDVPAPQ